MAQVYISQYARKAAIADSTISSSYAATASYVNPFRLDPIQDPNPTGLLYPSSTYLYQSASNTPLEYDMYIRQDGNVVKWKWIEGMLNTGLLYGGVLSYSASSFLITPGAGLIVDHNATSNSEIGPIVQYVSWNSITQSVENIGTYQNTFVYIDNEGSASQQNVFFAPEQYQFSIPLGRISHYDNIETNGSSMNVQTVYDIDRQQNVFIRAFGPLKLKGIATSGQTGTLRLNIGSGTAFNLGGYYNNDPNEPSIYNVSTYNTASIVKIYRSGSGYEFDNNGGSYYTTITTNLYDDGTGILASVGNNEWTIQRVMVNPITGRAHVYYGQNIYPTFDEAIAAIFSDEFVESDATANSYAFSAYLVVKGLTSDLTDDTENKIVQAGLFRSIGGGGGTGGGGIPGGQDTQIQFNNNNIFDGEPEFTYNYTDSIVTLTGSMLVSGAISASFGPSTVGFYGTSSWTVSASQAISASYAFSASYALSASQATTASYALTSSFSATSSYASSSPNFANTDLIFTGNRKHDTNRYSYFIYSDLVGGNETDPFQGFGVSGSFHYFNTGSNVLGTAAGSTNTYTYIEITSQSIDLSFNADPVVPSVYSFTNTTASFSSSLTVTKSVFFPGLTSVPQLNVVVIDTASGKLFYLSSSSLGGTATANIAISSSGTGLTATVASINFTGAGVATTNVGNNVTVNIPGGAGVAGGENTQIQFNSGSEFSGSGNFTFDYTTNTVELTGSIIISGSTALTGSMFVSGAISASFGPNTVGFFGTASWAQSASQAASASYAVTASYAATSSAAPSDTYIQYNKNGVLGAEEYFRYIYASHSLQNGYNTVALGNWSHTEGKGTIASGSYSTVVGQYNIALPSQSAFIIGDGTETLSAIGSGQLNSSPKIGDIVFTLKQISGTGPSVGDTITVVGGSGSETFTITSVKDYGGGSYDITVTPGAGQNFSSGDPYTIYGLVADRHNLLFASRSWFEVSASNVFLKGLPSSSQLNVLVYNSSSGQVYYTSSFGGGSGTPTPPGGLDTQIQFNSGSIFSGSGNFTFNYTNNIVNLTGSFITSGSTQTIGTASIDGNLFVGTGSAQALYTTAKITTVSGINTIYSLQTASYDGAFFDYTLISGLNARAGQIMSIWSGSEIRYTETTTTDIGSTSEFIFSVALTAGSASLQVTGSTGAIIKTIIKGI